MILRGNCILESDVKPMDDMRLWSLSFVVVIIVGSVVIFINLLIPDGTVFPTSVEYMLSNGYRLLSIFLGVLAGTSLSEMMKSRSNKNTGQSLLEDLIEELRVNLTLIGKGIPLRKGFWLLGIRSGRAEYLCKEHRRKLWDIYSDITHYNEDLQVQHRVAILEGRIDIDSALRGELESLCDHIKKRIEEFLEGYQQLR